MISESEKQEILESIFQDENFNNSEQYKKLLKYLLDCSIKGYVPSEIDVAINVFGKDKNFDPSEDTLVRVYIYKLRKKLQAYYEGRGKKDKIRLEIPKGHYILKFYNVQNRKKNSNIKNFNKFTNREIILFGLVVILIGFITIDYFSRRNSVKLLEPIDRNDPIWSDIFTNGLSTTLVIGDFLIFNEYDNELKKFRRVMDYEIITETQLDLFIQKYPYRKIRKLPLYELPHHCIFNIKDLIHVFYSFQKPVYIEMSSKLNFQNIQNRNLIYIGPLKNLRQLNRFLESLPINYHYTGIYDGEFQVIDNNFDTLYTFKTTKNKSIKNGLILMVKIPGPKKEIYFIIAGIGYGAQVYTIEMLSHQKLLLDFEKKIKAMYQYIPKYFTIILEVSSIHLVGYDFEIKYLNEIDKDFIKDLYILNKNF